MTGPDVRAVQEGLNTWSNHKEIATDGEFGSQTYGAVTSFQSEKGLTPDGVVGPLTRYALFPPVVATIAITANVLRYPRIGQPFRASPLRLASASGPALATVIASDDPRPELPADIISQLLPSSPFFTPTRFPGLGTPLPAPLIPTPPFPFGYSFDHCELAPGAQRTFAFTRKRTDSFVFTAQCIGTRGDPEGAHTELTFGLQMGKPLNVSDADGNAWTFNPFVQLTDVDRLGALGQFHLWQPYAQAGVQGALKGGLSPMVTLQAFPVNIGMDVGKFLTLTFGAGLFANYGLDDNKTLLGWQLTFGANIKVFSVTNPLF